MRVTDSGHRRFHIITALALAVMIIGEIGILAVVRDDGFTDRSRYLDTAQNAKSSRAYWARQIQTLGGRRAYELLQQEFDATNHGKRHNMAHLFGELLYKVEGLDGITVCDTRYEYGCYHGFLTRAIIQEGIDVIYELDKICVDTFGAQNHTCQHGMGHGVLLAVGRDKLAEALDICMTLTWQGETGGCRGGVFMEYDLPFMEGNDGFYTSVRPMGDDPFEPCFSLPLQHKFGCLVTHGQWWDAVYEHDFAYMGTLCNQLTDQEERDYCFEGVGQIIAPGSNYDPENMRTLCQLMPDEKTRMDCIVKAAWSTTSNEKVRPLSLEVCDGLPEEYASKCPTQNDLDRLP